MVRLGAAAMKFSLVVSTSAETAVGQALRSAKLAVEPPTVVDVFKFGDPG